MAEYTTYKNYNNILLGSFISFTSKVKFVLSLIWQAQCTDLATLEMWKELQKCFVLINTFLTDSSLTAVSILKFYKQLFPFGNNS